MGELILTTYDWAPEEPRGYVRDIRVRWALEEAGLPYRVEGVPFRARGAESQAQQVPWLTDGEQTICESGPVLLHLAERRGVLMPPNAKALGDVKKWLLTAVNSIETASLPWSLFMFSRVAMQTPGHQQMDALLQRKLAEVETVLAGCEWLAGHFSVADIVMADVLRLVDHFDGLADYPACRAYVHRATARPAFAKAHADQMAYFAAAD